MGNLTTYKKLFHPFPPPTNLKGVGPEKARWYWDEQGEEEQCAKAQVNWTI